MEKNFLFSNGFKTFMKLIFLAMMLLNVVRNEYFGTLSVSDFARGFLNGIQLVFMIAWIIYVLLCAANKENPFKYTKEE